MIILTSIADMNLIASRLKFGLYFWLTPKNSVVLIEIQAVLPLEAPVSSHISIFIQKKYRSVCKFI